MPNHCQNTLWVVGKPRDVKKFLDVAKNPRFGKKSEKPDWNGKFHKDDREWRIFERNHPCPEELRNTQSVWHGDKKLQKKQDEIEKANEKKYGSKNWYDWCCDNWGTKWGDYETHLESSGRNGARFTFDTAWCPGSKGLEKISSLHPELVFVNAYEESGSDFVGCDVFYRGRTIHAGSGNYPDGPDDWDDDEAVERYYEAVEKQRVKWLNRALAKMKKKTPYHAKKFEALV